MQLQLQFGQIQAPLPGIVCARVVAVAVAVAVLADPGFSGEEGEFQGQARPGPCSFNCFWCEKQDWQVPQVQFQQAQLVLAGIVCTRVVAVAVEVLADPGCSGKRENFRASPGPAHVALTVSGVKSRICRSLRCSSSRPS